jgi:hypothetical protein
MLLSFCQLFWVIKIVTSISLPSFSELESTRPIREHPAFDHFHSILENDDDLKFKSDEDLRLKFENGRILNGIQAKLGQFPYAVRLSMFNGNSSVSLFL